MTEMDLSVRTVGEGEEKEISVPSTTLVGDLVTDLDRNPEEYVVKVNDRIVPEDVELEDGDRVEIIPVVSGG